MTVTVKSCFSAWVRLSTGDSGSPQKKGEMAVLIAIGYIAHKSELFVIDDTLKKTTGDTFSHAKHPLSCYRDATFSLSWAGGKVQVTAADSKEPFLSYDTGTNVLPVKSMFVSGIKGPQVEWSIKYPCPKPPEEKCTKERKMCELLKERCNVDVGDCMDSVCHQNVSHCEYLKSTTFACTKAIKMSEIQDMTEPCNKECDKNQVMRLWPENEEMPTCVDRQTPDVEDGNVKWKFVCMCDHEENFFYEKGKCVPITDCGCVRPGGDYRQLNDEWTAADCSKDYKCEKVNNLPKVTETKRNCDKKSLCVKEEGKPKCVCPDKKGVPDMPDGCTGVPEKNQTCYLKGTDKELCICNKGYAPTCDGCHDINECALLDNLCKDRQRCLNLLGGYRCLCQDGYVTNKIGNCVDENECFTRKDPCKKTVGKSFCRNMLGTYGCECCAGYLMTQQGKCVRNTARFPVVPENSHCCSCPAGWPECLLAKASLGCYRNARGYYGQYSNFRHMYQDQCLRKEPIVKNRWTPGPCPSDKPTLPPLGSPQPTQPAPGFTTLEGPATPQECNAKNACERFPTPPSLQGSEVCGPADKEEQTYPSYCNMLVAMCNQAGGPDKFNPPANPTAKKGPCPTTPPPTTPSTLAPIEFGPWSQWTRCVPSDLNSRCGQGLKFRFRKTLPRQQRPPQPTELEDMQVCFIACPQTTTTPKPTDLGPPLPPKGCKDIGECNKESRGNSQVCGQIGTDRPDTFPSQCHLDALACNRRLPSHKLHNGKCEPEDKAARRFCNDTVVPLMKMHVHPEFPECKVMVPIGDCQNRLCYGGDVRSCCVTDTTTTIAIDYVCSDDALRKGQMQSATKCVCKTIVPEA